MGLLAEFHPSDLGFPQSARVSVMGITVEEEVDYSWACEAFVSAFITYSTEFVPVDTGYLQSTLDAYYDGDFSCTAITECEYAEYVEYGTWKQDAQPYFEPALEEAMYEFMVEAQLAYEEAYYYAEMEAEALLAEMQSEMSGGLGVGFGGGLLGALIGIGLMILLFPIALFFYTLAQQFKGSEDDSGSSSFGGGGIEIMII